MMFSHLRKGYKDVPIKEKLLCPLVTEIKVHYFPQTMGKIFKFNL